ncbi:MAG: hypothetical protein HKN85_00735 [Gammaproteobacteria bacterium]|nr:hypothetical protein [Gammaproteobacteria bacterium]
MKNILSKTLSLTVVFSMTAIAVLLTSGLSSAQESATPADQEISEGADSVLEHRAHHRKMKKKMHKHRGDHMDGKLLKLDTNEDGKVDLSEFLSHSERRFNEMDLNGDQFVTPEEARERHELMREEHRLMREQHKAARKKAREDRSKEKSSKDEAG